MAVQNYTVTNLNTTNSWKVTWSAATTGDTFTAFPLSAGFAGRTAQVEGTFGGGTTTINGSVDGTNFEPLTTNGSAACTFAAKGVKSVWELPVSIQPSVAGGTADSIVVTLYLHGTT